MPETLQRVIQALHDTSEERLKDARHSLITTPLNILTHLSQQATNPDDSESPAALTWTSGLLVSRILLLHLLTTALSLGLLYLLSVALVALFGLAQQPRLFRGLAVDYTRILFAWLGGLHLSIVLALLAVFQLDGPPYHLILMASLSGIFTVLLGAVLGGVAVVALWKMGKGTNDRLHWPNTSTGAVVGELMSDVDHDGPNAGLDAHGDMRTDHMVEEAS